MTTLRALLRWKAKIDLATNTHFFKKIAVCSRINPTVVFWRLRWLLESSKLQIKIKRKGYVGNLEEFSERMNSVSEEIYSDRN